MPARGLKTLAKKYGCPERQAEKFWSEAEGQYGANYAAVMGTVKQMLANYARANGTRPRRASAGRTVAKTGSSPKRRRSSRATSSTPSWAEGSISEVIPHF